MNNNKKFANIMQTDISGMYQKHIFAVISLGGFNK